MLLSHLSSFGAGALTNSTVFSPVHFESHHVTFVDGVQSILTCYASEAVEIDRSVVLYKIMPADVLVPMYFLRNLVPTN